MNENSKMKEQGLSIKSKSKTKNVVFQRLEFEKFQLESKNVFWNFRIKYFSVCFENCWDKITYYLF